MTEHGWEPAEWNRGAYLVEGLGHCGACHTPRNFLGAEDQSRALSGGIFHLRENRVGTGAAIGDQRGKPEVGRTRLLEIGADRRCQVTGPHGAAATEASRGQEISQHVERRFRLG